MSDHTVPNPNPEDEPMDLSTIDPDIVVLADYLANELTPEERAKVDARLASDGEFHEKAWPLIAAWTSPRELAGSAAHGLARVENVDGSGATDWEVTPEQVRQVANRVRATVARLEAEEDAPQSDVVDIATERVRRRGIVRRTYTRFEGWAREHGAAAVYLAAVGIPLTLYAGVPRAARIVAEACQGRASTGALVHPNVINAAPNPAATDSAARLAVPAAPVAPKPKPNPPTGSSTLVPDGLATAGPYVPETDSVASEPVPADTLIVIPGGTQVLLKAGGRFSYEIKKARGVELLEGVLDGEAVFEVHASGPIGMRVVTASARLTLTNGGRYAVRSDLRSDTTFVSVAAGGRVGGRGLEWATSNDVKGPAFVRYPRAGAAQVAASGEGFPVVPTELPVRPPELENQP